MYDEVLEKAVALTKELTVGNTVDNTFMGPVINKKQFDKIKNISKLVEKKVKLKSVAKLMIQQVTSLNQQLFQD